MTQNMWSDETKIDLQTALCLTETHHTYLIIHLTSAYCDACRWKYQAEAGRRVVVHPARTEGDRDRDGKENRFYIVDMI